jgi:cell division septal protein FtsQ
MVTYRKRHTNAKIRRIKPKKSILKRPWFWIALLILIVIFSLFYFPLFYSGFQVKNIVVYGNQKVATKDIENLISENINNKILGIGGWEIDSKSIFFINPSRLNKEILDNFSAIGSVNIYRKFMQTVEVQINERVPVAVFCPSAGLGYPDNSCFLIDKNGIAFEQPAILPTGIIVIQDATGASIFLGENVVQYNIMDLLSKVEKDLKDNFQITLKNAVIASSLRLNVSTDEGWQIYFDLSQDSDIDLQITKLNLLLNGGISADDMKKLKYIDLRPKGRAIICDNMECGG